MVSYNGALAGLHATFDTPTPAGKVECVLQRNHRVVDPAEIHASLESFGFRDGVAYLTKTQVARLKALLQCLDQPGQ